MLGLARGGVIVAYEIAKALDVELNLVIPRKIGAPDNPELAMGAVSEDEEVLLNHSVIELTGIGAASIQKATEKAKKEVEERRARYRKLIPPASLLGKTVILVDDGVATGFTMLAEIQSMRQNRAAKIIAASPVAGSRAWQAIKKVSDEAVCLHVESDFSGISEFYRDFSQVDDETILALFH